MRFSLTLTLIAATFIAFGQQNFKMVLNTSGYDEGVAAFQTTDYGFLVVGNTAAFGQGGSEVLVIALDSNAQFLWQKTYGTTGNDQATDAAIFGDNELIITGISTKSNPADVNIFMLHLDKYGVPKVFKEFGGPDWDMANSIAISNDSMVAIAGNSFNGSLFGQKSPFLLAVRLNGDTLWTSYLGSGSAEDQRDVIIDNNKTIYVSGATLKANGTADTGFIKAFDYSGNMLWQSFLDTMAGSIEGICFFQDSMIGATGYHYDSIGLWREPMIARFDKNGQVRLFRSEAQGGESYFTEITSDSSNLMAIAGLSTVHTNGGDEIYMGEFDGMGWYHKSNILGGKEHDWPASIQYNHFDSTFLVCGTTKSFNTSYSSILLNKSKYDMKFDTATIVLIISSMDENQNQPYQRISIYPNPTTEYLDVITDFPFSGNTNISILNLEGQEIFSDEIPDFKSYRLDINNLIPGVYMLQIRCAGRRITTKFIKK